MFKKEKTFFSILWAIPIAIMVVLLFSHTYNDIVITTRQGINFWNILKNGEFLRFYQVNILESGNDIYNAAQGCAYNILVYLVFAIWNIPLALLLAFTNIDVMNNVFCLAYSKLLPVTAMLISAYLLQKIFVLLGVPQKKQGVFSFLYLTSALMVSVVFIMSQYDLLGLIFQLLGIHAFLANKNRKFVFWFGIAFCFKYFSLVIFLPLLLLKQKRIVPCLKSLCGMLIPVLLTKLPFVFASGDASGVLVGEAMTVQYIQNMLAYTTNYMNLFIIVYILILVWCYLHSYDDSSKQLHFDAVWACFVSYAAFFCLCNAYPYWSILLAPFVVLVIAISPEKFYLNVLLETFGFAALLFTNMLKFTWCYFGNTMKSMVMPLLFPGASYEDSIIYSIITKLSENYLIVSLFHSVFIAAMVALAFSTFPKRPMASLEKWNDQAGYNDALAFRSVIVSVLCLMPVLSLFI